MEPVAESTCAGDNLRKKATPEAAPISPRIPRLKALEPSAFPMAIPGASIPPPVMVGPPFFRRLHPFQ